MKGLCDFCMRQNRLGRDVVVAALNSYGNQERSGWPHVMELVPRATKITSLTSTCALCHGVAECSRRINDLLPQEGTTLVGKDDVYIASCTGCFDKDISSDMISKHKENVRTIKWLSSSRGSEDEL